MSPPRQSLAEDDFPGQDDATRGARHADEEEARLLPTETFEFEDADDTAPTPARRKARPWEWLAGPPVARIQTIRPLFGPVQGLPVQVLDRAFPRRQHKVLALVAFLLFWAVAFVPPLWNSTRPRTDGTGAAVLNFDCVDALWERKNFCGLDGIDCQPFAGSSVPFRCPAECAGVQVLNPRAVGPLDVIYRPLVIGNDAYRGDSFVCASAIHAGVIPHAGGCGRVTLLGQAGPFPGAERHGLASIPFDSYFPLSFSVSADASIPCAREPRLSLLLVSVLFTATLSLCTASPAVLFFAVFTAVFAHVAFVSDPPPAAPHSAAVLPDRISAFAERFLPAALIATVLFAACVRRTLQGLDAHVEKTVLWLGGFWFGALSNDTLERWIPISRLRAHDIAQQPGAAVSLAVILLLLTVAVAGQAYVFWLERRLLLRLALYGAFVAGILVCLAIPGVELRIHHYVLGLLLLPGTSVQTRPSLLYQGILLGLFVNGAARWGFASMLQTADALRGDGALDSLVPAVGPPSISLASVVDALSNITFVWEPPPAEAGMDGISVLVNDVERLRRFPGNASEEASFTWSRPADLRLPEYFRFGFVKDRAALDYSAAYTWFANGTWGAG